VSFDINLWLYADYVAELELLAFPGQPFDQASHCLDRLDSVITYESVNTFDTMFGGDDSLL
jgi:hypothetical protein